MKLLLDENLPHKLRTLLSGHDCYTASWMGWSGIENGALLRLAADHPFDAFISTDRGLDLPPATFRETHTQLRISFSPASRSLASRSSGGLASILTAISQT